MRFSGIILGSFCVGFTPRTPHNHTRPGLDIPRVDPKGAGAAPDGNDVMGWGQRHPQHPTGLGTEPKSLGCLVWKHRGIWDAPGASFAITACPHQWDGGAGTASIQTLFQQLQSKPFLFSQQLLPRVPEIKPLLTHNASLAIRR